MAGPRQANPIDLTVQPGLFMQSTVRLALGRYTNGDNVRWYRGLPQKMGGYKEIALVDTNGVRTFYKGHARSYKQWDSLDGQNWIAFGTEFKLYLVNNGALYDITPLRYTSTIVNGFTTVAGSIVATVTDPNHGANTGDFVTYANSAAVGNQNFNKEFQVLAVIDLNTYTVQLPFPASLSTTGGGTTQAQYQWPIGLTSDGTLTGYGTGTYGTGTYGTPRTGSTFGGFARIWSLDNWGEDLLASPNGEALFWWQRQAGPDSRALIRPTAPANIEHMLVGPDDRHVIALGTNLLSQDASSVTGQQDKMFMRWCQGDNFDVWVETVSNDAGSKRLDTGSRLVTAVKTRTAILIFSDEGLYTVSLTGGQDVYQVTPLGGSFKIISAGAGADVDGVVYWMGLNSFYFFNGVINDLPCDVADYVFGSAGTPRMNRQMQSKITCQVNQSFTEITWNFPSVDSDENDSRVVYNWASQVWYVSSIKREVGSDVNVFYGTPIGINDQGFFMDEDGFDRDVEEPLLNFLQTWEGEFAMTMRHDVPQNQTLWANASGSMLMLLHTLYPDLKELSNISGGSPFLTVQVQGREYSGDPLVYGDILTITPTTDQVDPQFCQRRASIYTENYNFGDFWRMGDYRGLATPVGRRS